MQPISGMPGTVSEQATRIKWERLLDTEFCYLLGGARRYRALVPDGVLVVVVSRDPVEGKGLRWHLSISHQTRAGQPGRLPNWDEMKVAKYQLLPRDVDVPMVLIFPRKQTVYVNVHDTCLHLWESTEPEIDA